MATFTRNEQLSQIRDLQSRKRQSSTLSHLAFHKRQHGTTHDNLNWETNNLAGLVSVIVVQGPTCETDVHQQCKNEQKQSFATRKISSAHQLVVQETAMFSSLQTSLDDPIPLLGLKAPSLNLLLLNVG